MIAKHHKWLSQFYDPTKDVYKGQLYVTHPDFKKFFENYHPLLAQHYADAMEVFADRRLT